MRIAVVGAYGNGKTTLATALSERLDLPRLHGSPMRGPSGHPQRSLEECDDWEVFELLLRRLMERTQTEARYPAGFISDGSVLHEWVYATVRLAFGLHPDPLEIEAWRAGNAPAPAPLGAALERAGSVVKDCAAQSYDYIIMLPSSIPLRDSPPPISESFRTASDRLLAHTLAQLGLRVRIVDGPLEHRVSVVMRSLGQAPVPR